MILDPKIAKTSNHRKTTMGIKLDIEPAELDFICNRLVAGQMDFQTAMNSKAMMDKLVRQANDKTIQSMQPPPPPAADEIPSNPGMTG